MGSANRTPSGAPSQAARDKHGGPGGAFPIFDHDSADSAINLRHNSDQESASSVLNRAAAWAKRNGNGDIAMKVGRAKAADRKR